MTKSTECLIFCTTSNAFTKYSYFLCLLTLILSSVSLSHKWAYRYRLPRKHLLKLVHPISCLLYTLSMSNFIIDSTKYYRVMSGVELNKDFTPSKKPTPIPMPSRQSPVDIWTERSWS